MNTKPLNLFTAAISLWLVSCADIILENPRPTTAATLGENTRPTLIRLHSNDVELEMVRLRWNGAVPEMNMDNANSGEGWATGNSEEDGIFWFGQNKFYGLELDFTRKTFVESGFDGGPLPEIAGSWSVIR